MARSQSIRWKIELRSSSVRQYGFSLLEVLVALAIMALALGMLYQSMGGSVKASQTAEDIARAVISAESILAGYPVVTPGGGREAGLTPDGFGWVVNAEVFDPQVAVDAGIVLYRVLVTVSWGSGGAARSITMVSVVPEGLPSE